MFTMHVFALVIPDKLIDDLFTKVPLTIREWV